MKIEVLIIKTSYKNANFDLQKYPQFMIVLNYTEKWVLSKVKLKSVIKNIFMRHLVFNVQKNGYSST